MKIYCMAKVAGVFLAVSSLVAQDGPQPPPKPKEGPRRVEARSENRNNNENRNSNFNFERQFQLDLADVNQNVTRVFGGAGEGMDHPLVISSGGLDEKAIGNLEEDMTIMARIFGKAMGRQGGDESSRKAMGIQLWALGEGGRGGRNMYIEGHGAVFVLNVNMPLVGSRVKEETEEKTKESDSTWEAARNELYGKGEDGVGPRRRLAKERTGPGFDAERVEQVKKSLSDALKNAGNIRGLKENESVTVVVQAPGTGKPTPRLITGGGEVKVEAFAYGPVGGGGPRTVMTLRAKKGDIDAFAKGKLDGDEFRKKVAISTYQSGGREK